MIRNIILVGVGGGVGSILRYVISYLIKSNSFPYSTLVINVIGSMILGALFGLSLKNENWDAGWKAFMTAGFCGGFTTFSAFSYENVLMLQQGKIGLSLIYTVSSIVAGILAAYFGLKFIS